MKSKIEHTLSWITSGFFLIFKIHLYQIIWLSAILAFRFAFSRLHSSGLLHVTGSLANVRLRPTKNLAPFHNFYKIVLLRSVFAPVEFSSKTLTSPINYFALYSEAGSLPRLKLRTAYAFFLTIRQSQQRIRSPSYKPKTKNV